MLDDASRTIDPALAGGPWFDATGPWIAEVLVRHRQGAIGIQWSNAPTDADAAALGLGWQGAGSTCADADANGWPDVCPVPFSPDLDDDGEVGSADLGILLSAWGEPDPRVDLDRGGAVDSSDLGILLSAWGPAHE